MALLAVTSCKTPKSSSDSSGVLEVTDLGGGGVVDLTQFRNPGGLGSAEVQAIHLYTQDDTVPAIGGKYYAVINKALRDGDSGTLQSLADIVKNVASATNKLRNGPCTTRRYVDLPYSVVQKMQHVGQRYVEKSFYSSTRNTAPPQGFGAKTDVIVATSSNCPMVEQYSVIPSEKEVLFPPGTEFSVTRESLVEIKGGTYFNTFFVEEIPPGQGVHAQPINVGLGNFANHNDNTPAVNEGPTIPYSKFVDRTYSGTGTDGKQRSVHFLANKAAKYVGASGVSQPATWAGDGYRITLNTGGGASVYKISDEEKICYLPAGQAKPTESCLIYDKDDDGNGDPNANAGGNATPPPAIDPVTPPPVANGGVTFKDLIGSTYTQSDSGRAIKFEANRGGSFDRGNNQLVTIKWSFYDQPARVKIESGGKMFWYRVDSADKVCPAGDTVYNANAGGTCFEK